MDTNHRTYQCEAEPAIRRQFARTWHPSITSNSLIEPPTGKKAFTSPVVSCETCTRPRYWASTSRKPLHTLLHSWQTSTSTSSSGRLPLRLPSRVGNHNLREKMERPVTKTTQSGLRTAKVMNFSMLPGISSVPSTQWPPSPETTVDSNIFALWAGLVEERGKVIQLRATLSGKRSELQALRHESTLADNEFMKLIRPVLATKASPGGHCVRTFQNHADTSESPPPYRNPV